MGLPMQRVAGMRTHVSVAVYGPPGSDHECVVAPGNGAKTESPRVTIRDFLEVADHQALHDQARPDRNSRPGRKVS